MVSKTKHNSPHHFYRFVILVDTGCKAFKFNKFSGVCEGTYKEGYHLKMPWLEKQVIYNVKS